MKNEEAKVHHIQDRYAQKISNVEKSIEIIPKRLTGKSSWQQIETMKPLFKKGLHMIVYKVRLTEQWLC